MISYWISKLNLSGVLAQNMALYINLRSKQHNYNSLCSREIEIVHNSNLYEFEYGCNTILVPFMKLLTLESISRKTVCN